MNIYNIDDNRYFSYIETFINDCCECFIIVKNCGFRKRERIGKSDCIGNDKFLCKFYKRGKKVKDLKK